MPDETTSNETEITETAEITAVVSQNEDRYNGCIPLDKSDTVVIDGGAPADIEYQLRDGNGTPLDISAWFPDDGEESNYGLGVRFALADQTVVARHNVEGSVTDAKTGKVSFTIPEYVYGVPCIYCFYFGVFDKQDNATLGSVRHVFPGRGVLLVEWSPWIAHLDNCSVRHRVVPALQDVRRKLDDFLGKNDLMKQVEFSADDIVHAMVRPVHLFNETPPLLRRFHYNLSTFPYYDNWITGTAGELMQIAVMHYVRNKLQVNHGGISGDEKNRDRDYLQISQMFKEEYRSWVRLKKHELNFRVDNGFGSVTSPYLRLR